MAKKEFLIAVKPMTPPAVSVDQLSEEELAGVKVTKAPYYESRQEAYITGAAFVGQESIQDVHEVRGGKPSYKTMAIDKANAAEDGKDAGLYREIDGLGLGM